MKAPKGVPRDEWLLARMLAADSIVALSGSLCARGSDRSAAFNGRFVSVLAGCQDSDEGNPDAYAAGAALAMALEGGHE